MLNWFQYVGTEHASKLESKHSWIQGTKIQMVEWENNRNDLLSVRNILDTRIIELLGETKGTSFSKKCCDLLELLLSSKRTPYGRSQSTVMGP